MQRIYASHAPAIADALDYIPERLRDLTTCDFFCGDALFAGAIAPDWTAEEIGDGRSYRDHAHCCFPYHMRDRRITVVLPNAVSPEIVLHELGHVVHCKLWEQAGTWDVAELEPCSEYAKTDILETFAEAFLAWFYTPRSQDEEPYWLGHFRANDEFFDRLLVG